jgi:hypothetical protein
MAASSSFIQSAAQPLLVEPNQQQQQKVAHRYQQNGGTQVWQHSPSMSSLTTPSSVSDDITDATITRRAAGSAVVGKPILFHLTYSAII